MDVSIIIVNYNTLSTTAACIDRIVEATIGVTFEIIIFDNASTDGSREHFSADRRVSYIYHHENIGFGRANNQALERARGRNILFLNPDTLLVNDAVSILSHYLDRNADVAVVGGDLFDERMRPALSFRRLRPSIWWELSLLLWQLPQRLCFPRSWYFNRTIHPIDVGYITGADLMARRADLLAAKGFAPEFFMYYEDTDLCHRLNKTGRIVALPDAQIQHLEGGSFDTHGINPRRVLLTEQGRHIYYQRNHSPRHHSIANRIYMLTLRLHGAIHRLLRHHTRAADYALRLKIVKDLQRSIQSAR